MPVVIEKAVGRIMAVLAVLGAAGVILMLLHVTAYVVSRHVMATPLPATVEVVSHYYMILVAFLPIAWAELRGDMIAVEVLDPLFAPAFRKWLTILVALLTCAAYLILTYTTWLVAMREFEARSFVISLSVALPTWPSYFILPVGFALAAMISLYRAAETALGRVGTGDATARTGGNAQ